MSDKDNDDSKSIFLEEDNNKEEEEEIEEAAAEEEDDLKEALSCASMSLKPPINRQNRDLMFDFPHIEFVWQDRNRNKRFNIEFHVPSSADENTFDMDLTPDGRFLLISGRFNNKLFKEDVFMSTCTISNKEDKLACAAARRNKIEDMKKTFSFVEARRVQIPYKTCIRLPFPCENPQNPSASEGKYPTTGIFWNSIPLSTKEKDSFPKLVLYPTNINRNGKTIKGIANILSISLVVAVKNKKIKQITPKKIFTNVVMDSDDSDDEDYVDNNEFHDASNIYVGSDESGGIGSGMSLGTDEYN